MVVEGVYSAKAAMALSIKYGISMPIVEEVNKYNKLYENFDIIKLENYEGAIGPGETKYIIVYFRALSEAEYKINLTLHLSNKNVKTI